MAYEVGEHYGLSLDPNNRDAWNLRARLATDTFRLCDALDVPPHEVRRITSLNVLDIACGRPCNNLTMHPWWCRLMHAMGNNVTGIDLPYDPDFALIGWPTAHAEAWTFLPMDLRDPSQLSCIPEKSQDITHTSFFILNEREEDNCPLFKEKFEGDRNALQRVSEDILRQMRRITRRGGWIMVNNRVERA